MQQPQPQQQQYPYSTPAFHTTGYGAPQPNVQPFSSQPGYQWRGNVPQPPTAANLSPTPPGPHLEQPETLEKHMEKVNLCIFIKFFLLSMNNLHDIPTCLLYTSDAADE